ncbi:ABC transporter permease [Nonomuraea sp. NPDC050328]|uniref:ABC transporter permease n=1 Tax=Nonomuraea sp. NPDC050328 TaxID=3364361 RepID=UPI00379DEAA1
MSTVPTTGPGVRRLSPLALTLADSATMIRRSFKHALRYPSMTISTVLMPAFMLLLFVGLFGRSMGAGLAGTAADGLEYVDFVAPGVLVVAAAAAGVATSVAVCVDMTKGIVNRFRTMSIARTSVLTGHVVGSVVQAMAGVILVAGIALAMGFRPTAGVLEWLGALGLLTLLSFALTWLSVALGLLAKNPEGASNTPLLFQLLPFLGSAFVPTETLPSAVRWFAEYQPFTPINATLRGLLLGLPVGDNAIIAVAWCLVLAVAGYAWSKMLFNRR